MRENLLRRVAFGSEETSSALYSDTPVVLLMVYRRENVRLVKALLRQVPSNADIRLWALDEIAPELASQTVGFGHGTRFSNLNKLHFAKPTAEGSWVVLVDDDVLFVRGNLSRTISVMKRAGLSLAQPSQSIIGWWTSLFNVGRPLLTARDTNYVEQGPLLVVDPSFAELILPFPDEDDMGWGIEAQWYRAKEGRFRIGVIDDCRIVHWTKTATPYAVGPELISMRERVSRAGLDSIWQLQSTNGYWWKWQQSPSWGNA
jgi:hypothetical protein